MDTKVQLIDCTLRDGGYYNNWNFSKSFIQKYLNIFSKTEIRNIEIGFLTIPENRNKGITANCNKFFFKRLVIPKNVNCGIMINGSDFLNNQLNETKIFNHLEDIPIKSVKFIRFACQIYEISKIKKYILYLKRKGFKIFVNIMQISEVKKKEIKNICNELRNICDVIYIADSLGSLNKRNTKSILKNFQKFTKKPLGIHTHDNISKAFENSIAAYKCEVEWIDGTMQGMGRGPGNVKTEDLVKYFFKKDSNTYKQISNLSKKFLILKKKYKWGTNQYYYLSGLHKIHPTYIQMLISDDRYKDLDYKEVIKNLKKLNARKYNPNTMFLAMNFFKKKFINNQPEKNKIKLKKNPIIFGNGKTLKNKNFFKNELFKESTNILINRSRFISDKDVDLISYCHPLRLMADINYIKKYQKKILMPYDSIPGLLQKKIKKDNIINFNFNLGSEIKLSKQSLILPNPLNLVYCICYLISKSYKKIYIAGFDGFTADDPFKDETQININKIKKIFPAVKIISLTKTTLIL